MKKLLDSSDGLTLVEVLIGLVLSSIISIVIINFLLNGMNSYEQTSNDVALHHDANFVMTLFVKEIYQSMNVRELDNSKIEILTVDGDTKELGFKNNKAFIGKRNDFSTYHFSDESSIQVKENENGEKKVEIQIVIENERSTLELSNEVFIGAPLLRETE